MFKKIFILVSVMIFACLNPVFAQTEETLKNITQMRQNYVQVLQDGQPIGTGSIINIDNKKYIITCFHVVAEAIKNKEIIEIRFFNQETATAKIFKIDPLRDMVLLGPFSELPIESKGIFLSDFVNSKDITYGTNLYKIGTPNGEFCIISAATYSGKAFFSQMNYSRFNSLTITSPVSYFGDSGGIVFNEGGQYIGMCFAVMFINYKNGILMPIGMISVNPAERVKESITFMFSKIQNTSSAHIKGAKIVGIACWLLRANIIGLMPDDSILEIESAPVDDADFINNIIRSFDKGDEIKMKIKRNGKIMDVKVKI